MSVLVALSGLPGVGKSAVAEDVGRALGAPVLSVDPVEAAVRRAGVGTDSPTGLAAYVAVEVLAEEQLRLGLSVVVDAVNDVEPAREQWHGLARRREVPLRFVEVVCPDEDLHRRRLEGRRRDLPGFPEPSWESVQARRPAFRDWPEDRLVLDSRRDRAANLVAVLVDLERLTGRRS